MSLLQRGDGCCGCREVERSVFPRPVSPTTGLQLLLFSVNPWLRLYPLKREGHQKEGDRALASFCYLGIQSDSQGGGDACGVVKMSKIRHRKNAQLNSSCHSRFKNGCRSGKPIASVSSHRKGPEKSLVSPSWHINRESGAGNYQTAHTDSRQEEASLVLNQLCESIIKSINSQCECSRQMDEHLSAIWSRERVRFIFKACLSHFSCLVLEGRACICDFSNASTLQLFYSVRDWAPQTELSRTSGFCVSEWRQRGTGLARGLSPCLGLSAEADPGWLVLWAGLPHLAVTESLWQRGCDRGSSMTSEMGLQGGKRKLLLEA